MKYLKLIRYQNLLLLAFMQFIFRYGYLKLHGIPLALSDFLYFLLVIATVLIAAGGYVINNILDQDVDNQNKPNNCIVGKSIPETTAYNIYIALTLIGVSIGYYLSYVIQRPNFVVFFILCASLLYFYATQLKQMPLIGNIVIALLVSFSILIIAVFDIFPALYEGNKTIMMLLFKVLKDYAVFCFLIHLIREIIKDLEDYEGDFNHGLRTLPVVIGIKKTTFFTIFLLSVSVALLLYYIYVNLMDNNLLYSVIYALIFIVTPLLFCIVKLLDVNQKTAYKNCSTVLKWVMFFGILSITIIHFNILHNAKG